MKKLVVLLMPLFLILILLAFFLTNENILVLNAKYQNSNPINDIITRNLLLKSKRLLNREPIKDIEFVRTYLAMQKGINIDFKQEDLNSSIFSKKICITNEYYRRDGNESISEVKFKNDKWVIKLEQNGNTWRILHVRQYLLKNE